ncbi:hypothetical protein ACFX15_012608 [Malus domestica]
MDGGNPHSGLANYLQPPVLTNAISPMLDRGTKNLGNTNLVASAMLAQYALSNNLQFQQAAVCKFKCYC